VVSVPRRCERGQQRQQRRVAAGGRKIVESWAVKHSQPGAAHHPQMQSCDVGVADECFRVAAKEIGVQVGKNPHRAVTTGSADHGLDLGVFPDGHQIVRALFVLVLLEPAESLNLGLDDDFVPGFFHRLDAAAEPVAIRGVGGADDSNRISLRERRRS